MVTSNSRPHTGAKSMARELGRGFPKLWVPYWGPYDKGMSLFGGV